jgi:hypothetical protein
MMEQNLDGIVGGPFSEIFNKYSTEFGKMGFNEIYGSELAQIIVGVIEPQGEYRCEFRKNGDLLVCHFDISKTSGELVASKYVCDFETPKNAIDEIIELIRIRDGLKEKEYEGMLTNESWAIEVVYTVDFESPEHLDQLLADFTEVFNCNQEELK